MALQISLHTLYFAHVVVYFQNGGRITILTSSIVLFTSCAIDGMQAIIIQTVETLSRLHIYLLTQINVISG